MKRPKKREEKIKIELEYAKDDHEQYAAQENQRSNNKQTVLVNVEAE